DLVAVVVVAAPITRVRADDPAAARERPHVVREPRQRALHQLLAGRHVDIHAPSPPRFPQRRELIRRQTLRQREHSAAEVGHAENVSVGRGEAPGRINLIGEHTDYNEGFVLPAVLRQSVSVSARARNDELVRATSEGFPSIAFSLRDEDRAGGWADHVRGVTWALRD